MVFPSYVQNCTDRHYAPVAGFKPSHSSRLLLLNGQPRDFGLMIDVHSPLLTELQISCMNVKPAAIIYF
jgi:hypothetical protein